MAPRALTTEDKLEFLLTSFANAGSVGINWANVAIVTKMSSGSKAREKFKRIIEEAGTHQLTSDNSIVPVKDNDGEGGNEAPETPKSTTTKSTSSAAKKGGNGNKKEKNGEGKKVTPKKRKLDKVVEDEKDGDVSEDKDDGEEEV